MKLIICTLIITILFISCSAKATAPANFSESDTTTENQPSNPEQKPEEEKPSVPEVKPEQPAMKITGGQGAIQFDGLVFENSTLRAEVKTIYHNHSESIIVLSDGREYGCGIPVGENGQSVPQIQYRLTPRDHSYSYSGTATFRNDGYLHLSIGGNNQALKLVK